MRSNSSRAMRAASGFALDAGLVACGLIASALVAPAPALAYVDPSVMTYTIQALAGVAVALSAVFGVAYRRLRKKAVRVFGIDENAGKVIDPDVRRVEDAQDLASENERLGRFWRNAPKPGEARELSYLEKFWRSLIVCLFTCGTLLLLAPIELMVANSGSLTYGLGVVWGPILVTFLVVSLALAALISLVRGRAFDIARAIVASIGIGFWLQALFMNTGLPQANGATIDWLEFWPWFVGNTLIWAALIAAAIVYARMHPKRMRSLVTGLCSVFLVVTLVGAGISAANPASAGKGGEDEHVYVTGDGINTLSPSKNIVVFVLDMYDTSRYLDVVKERPHMMDEFTGFTFYRNATGSGVPTKYGVPYLLTGSWPKPDDDFADFLDTRYHRSTFLQDLHNAGYDLGIYTDTMGIPGDYDFVQPLTINQHPLEKGADADADWMGTSAIMTRIALYRDAPWVLKPLFWYYTDDINTDITGDHPDINKMPYLINDVRYHDCLMRDKLQVVDRGSRGSFRFIHLNGAHFPYTMTSDMHETVHSSYEDQAEGAMDIVSDYLRQLKKLGLYDSTTVIVTSDHGDYHWGTELPEQTTNPIMFVKPAQSAAQDAEPLKTSDVQTGHLDFAPTVMYAATGDASAYGNPAWRAPEKGRIRHFLFPYHNGKVDTRMTEMEIDGDALDFSDWKPDGVHWDYEFYNGEAAPRSNG